MGWVVSYVGPTCSGDSGEWAETSEEKKVVVDAWSVWALYCGAGVENLLGSSAAEIESCISWSQDVSIAKNSAEVDEVWITFQWEPSNKY